MNDIEKLKEAQAESLRNAIEENRIFMELPIPPKRVGFGTSVQPWATYEVDTLEEALDIFKMYEPEPWVIAKDGRCTVFNTWEHIETKYNNRHPAQTGAWRRYEVEYNIDDGAPYFDCRQGVGYGGTDMEFFTKAAGVNLKIVVEIKHCPIRVNLVSITPFSRADHRKYRKDYPRVPGANCVHWGYGDDCCKGTYWFGDLTQFWAAMSTYVSREGIPE